MERMYQRKLDESENGRRTIIHDEYSFWNLSYHSSDYLSSVFRFFNICDWRRKLEDISPSSTFPFSRSLRPFLIPSSCLPFFHAVFSLRNAQTYISSLFRLFSPFRASRIPRLPFLPFLSSFHPFFSPPITVSDQPDGCANARPEKSWIFPRARFMKTSPIGQGDIQPAKRLVRKRNCCFWFRGKFHWHECALFSRQDKLR